MRRRATMGKLQAPPTRFAGDPRVEPDAPCFVCCGERNAIAKANEDPFCSGECCRSYYDVRLQLAGGSKVRVAS